MHLEDGIAILRRLPLFAAFDDEPLRLLAFSAERVRRREGQRLFTKGAPAFTALVLIEGEVAFTDAQGDEIARAGPPALIGERALIADAVRPSGAVMASAGSLIEIPRLLMRRVLEEYPETVDPVERHLFKTLDAQMSDFERIAARLDALGSA